MGSAASMNSPSSKISNVDKIILDGNVYSLRKNLELPVEGKLQQKKLVENAIVDKEQSVSIVIKNNGQTSIQTMKKKDAEHLMLLTPSKIPQLDFEFSVYDSSNTSVSQKSKFRCHICEKTFLDRPKLLQHIQFSKIHGENLLKKNTDNDIGKLKKRQIENYWIHLVHLAKLSNVESKSSIQRWQWSITKIIMIQVVKQWRQLCDEERFLQCPHETENKHLYSGQKYYWRYNLFVEIHIFHHYNLDCLEIILRPLKRKKSNFSVCEVSRQYLKYSQMLQHVAVQTKESSSQIQAIVDLILSCLEFRDDIDSAEIIGLDDAAFAVKPVGLQPKNISFQCEVSIRDINEKFEQLSCQQQELSTMLNSVENIVMLNCTERDQQLN